MGEHRPIYRLWVGLGGLLSLWGGLTYSGLVPEFFLSTPHATFSRLLHHVQQGTFWIDVLASILRIVFGLILSIMLAVPIAGLLIFRPAAAHVTMPIISVIRYLPVPALMPLLVLWFGIGEFQKISIVFVGVFFQLVVMVHDAMKATADELKDIARVNGATDIQIITGIVLPQAAPGIFDAIRVSLGWAWGWVTLAEIIGATSGIGFMIVKAQRFLNTADVMVGLLVIGFLGYVSDRALTQIRGRIFLWQ